MDIEPGELTVGQLAERSGVAISALHFYERQNLIISRRTSGNQRRYKRDTLRRVAMIRIAQRVGIPLAEVAAILALLPDNRTPTRQDWEHISECWQSELDRRIIHLEQLRDDFKDCVGCGCLSLDRCALANPYDALATKGPGPQRLLTPSGAPTQPPATNPPPPPPAPFGPGGRGRGAGREWVELGGVIHKV